MTGGARCKVGEGEREREREREAASERAAPSVPTVALGNRYPGHRSGVGLWRDQCLDVGGLIGVWVSVSVSVSVSVWLCAVHESDTPSGAACVQGLTELAIHSVQDMMEAIDGGSQQRSTSTTGSAQPLLRIFCFVCVWFCIGNLALVGPPTLAWVVWVVSFGCVLSLAYLPVPAPLAHRASPPP
eukprot:158785-Rhodomonas_salina.3